MTDAASAVAMPGRISAGGWIMRVLIGGAWLSMIVWAGFITIYYGGNLAGGMIGHWNEGPLPDLYARGQSIANAGIGAHFFAGAVLMLLAPLQLSARVRAAWPAFHRWSGRICVATALVTGVGGLAFIFAKGTIGGMPMNIGFGLYGVLLIVTAANAWRYARARRFDQHRVWAIRLSALVIASWLYRVEYTAWGMLTHCLGCGGRGPDGHRVYDGVTDWIMMFFFYVPTLIVGEAFIGAVPGTTRTPGHVAASIALGLVSLLLVAVGALLAASYWLPLTVKQLS